MTLQAIKPVDKIWKDGKLIPWAEGNVHLITHALHYGYGAFEGIRAYRTHDNRTAIFRLDAHLRRFSDSAKILMIPNEYSAKQLEAACHDTLRVNKMTEGYLRPLIFVGEGALGFGAMDNPTCVAVLAWDWGAYLGSDGVANG